MRLTLALSLMVASGFAGLGYQVVWTRQTALWLGHESAAVLAVVAAFFCGLGLGAWALGRLIDRSPSPARWYAGLEALIAAWGIVLALSIEPAGRWMLDVTGAQPRDMWQWTVAFFGTFCLLLPATAAMGATLPAMEQVLAQFGRREIEGTSRGGIAGEAGSEREADASAVAAPHALPVAALYAANTAGAVLGVLAVAFWLLPAAGLAASAAVCGGLNVLCAVLALLLVRRPVAVPQATPLAESINTSLLARDRGVQPQVLQAPLAVARRLTGVLAASGLLGIGYEVLVVRVLSQVAENTVYTFALLLAVYLIGTALGAAACARWGARADVASLADRLLVMLAAACLLGTASLWFAPQVKAVVAQAGGGTLAAALGAEAVLALLAFLPPTVAMGALFSHLCTQGRILGVGLGRCIGVNAFGAALAPLVFGVWLLPAIGPKGALLLLAAGYLLLISPRALLRPGAALVMAAVVAYAVWAPALDIVDVPEGGHVKSHSVGAMAAVSVVEDAAGVARLHIDNRQQEGSSATELADARQALLPLLLHSAPRRALFLGLGTGVTARTATLDPELDVDAVELLPEVVEASAFFAPTGDAASPTRAARLHLLVADARRWVRATDRRYDLIVSDNFHPARSGSGALYTVEHFEAVRLRLAPEGVFCQWLPLHQLDLPTLRSIVRTFGAVFPGMTAVLATNSLSTPVVGLVGRAEDRSFDAGAVAARVRRAANWSPPSAAYGLSDEMAVLGSFIGGPASLMRFAGDAPLNTDDHPFVSYTAPRVTYAPDSTPSDRLMALLQGVSFDPADVLGPESEAVTRARLAAYAAARQMYIDTGRTVQPSADVRKMLAQVQQPLLAVLRTSPDFAPAYDPLLAMAVALSSRDAAAARSLLQALAQAHPHRAEASQALQRLATP